MGDAPRTLARLSNARPVKVAALFTRADSVYRALGVECFDLARDARSFELDCAVIAHPPCRAWSRLRTFAKPRPDEKDLARWALHVVRHCGGVLEHPSGSALFREGGLPRPGSIERDSFGGWCLPVSQSWWGHRAEKRTWLYVCGVEPRDVPRMPLSLGRASHTCGSAVRDKSTRRPEISKSEREHSPVAFAQWLVELASRVTH